MCKTSGTNGKSTTGGYDRLILGQYFNSAQTKPAFEGNPPRTIRDHANLWIATHQLGRRNLTEDPAVSAMVRAGDISLVEGKKIVAPPVAARAITLEAIDEGKDTL